MFQGEETRAERRRFDVRLSAVHFLPRDDHHQQGMDPTAWNGDAG